MAPERESRNSFLFSSNINSNAVKGYRDGEGRKNLNQNGLKASLVFNGISPEGVCTENSLCGAY